MRFRILGRLDVFDGTRWLQLSAAKQRALLARLIVNNGRFVSSDALISELWGEQVPDSAAKSLQVYVHRLRRGLGDAGVGLRTRPGGYELDVAPGDTDADRFRTLAESGRAALEEGRAERAVGLLAQALSLWRGPALCDVPPGPVIRTEAARLAECRLTVWEGLADAKLAAGRSAELATELGALVAEHPLREPLWARLMLALHRSGRRSDALQAYVRARRVLVTELGVEPGEELQRVHAQVLGTSRTARRAAPCQLPAGVPDFVGRREPLAAVQQALTAETRVPRVVVVTGVAGAGKSAFAVHAAHLLRAAFPDGQLHTDLRTGDNRAADPCDALASLLKSLGTTATAIPDGLHERARRYRAELADRRTLVLLDNARGERQVRPLLPGTGGSAVIVTSRAGLAGLEGAVRIDLGLLGDGEALELLARAVGDDRPRRDPAAAARIAARCGNLPLALRIAGARLATRRHLSLPRLADALDDEHRRLDELVAGDLEVRASVSQSYETLDDGARRALRLLGLLDTPAVPGWVAGALLDRPSPRAERALDTLVDAHLVEVTGPGSPDGEPRYRLHDLVRLFARERAAAEESAEERRAAVGRVYAAYLDLARSAEAALGSGLGSPAHLPQPRPWRAGDDRFASPTGPLQWLEAERATLCALVRQASAAGDGQDAAVAWRLASSLAGYFETAAHFDDWRDTHETALAAARSAKDTLGTAVLHRTLGELNTVQDRYADAVTSFRQSLAAYGRLPSPRGGRRPDPGEAAAAAGLGMLLRVRGQYGAAVSCLRRAVGTATAAGHTRAEAYARCGLGSLQLERGEPEAARKEFERALALSRKDGHPRGVATAERYLGLVALAEGRLDTARERVVRSRELCAEYGNRIGEVHALHWLGHILDAQGESAAGERMIDESLAAYRRFGEHFGEALALRSRADLLLHTGRADAALEAVRQALAVWSRLASPYWTSRTFDLLAQVQAASGDLRGKHAAARAQRRAVALRASAGLSPGLAASRTPEGRSLGGHLTLAAAEVRRVPVRT
ncbi:Regulatory protein AfsR [Streptomyces sp. RB5]|uniref:Regulatory protein AfsR n=1 Tax=Streptomyces smaragdinus TaxID=2585196 RepID=A0A7K0CI91_9ACTN|nr:BTAD domain-containing putative transcriptional regulator [Streptomyces smaragdinus]MQY13195.1 Regulatory protein AfsR [Streptomyces smaragdinus]